MLPLRWLNPLLNENETRELIDSWMRTFGLDLDISQRPVCYHAGELKMLSFVRTLLIAPKVLMIDDPYYMLNKPERENLFRNLRALTSSYPMLIASLDDDFGDGFADQIIDLSDFRDVSSVLDILLPLHIGSAAMSSIFDARSIIRFCFAELETH
jgi:ABC-type branched-subunit amino acid transport system ATPase component